MGAPLQEPGGGQGRGARRLGWGAGLTRSRELPERGIDQREVQHGRGLGPVAVQEQVALLRLPQLLGSGLHGREGDALLLAEPADQLQLLQGRSRRHQRAPLQRPHPAMLRKAAQARSLLTERAREVPFK